MLEINSIEVNDLIEKELLDKYYSNIERIRALKEKERELIKEIEIKNYKNKKEMNEIEKENRNIELMIENILLATDKSKVTVYDSDITLNKKYKISARPNKKDKNHFIKFIEFMNKVEMAGSQKTQLTFTEKNREENKKR